MRNRIEVTREITAPPQAVYDAISDITRMGEWSEECHCCEYHPGFSSPVVGATFDGHNRNGDNNWTTQGKITLAEPGKEFVFECSAFDFHFSTWGYLIEETPNGSKVTEYCEDLRPDSAIEYSQKTSGIIDRDGRNRHTMSQTLENLAAALENT